MEERHRLDALRTELAASDFLAARYLARLLVAEVADTAAADVTLVQLCPSCGKRGHGAPRAVAHSVHVSWSHSGGYVAAAVSQRRRVGVDIEPHGRIRLTPSLVNTAFPEAESGHVLGAVDPDHEFLRLWTVKEAMMKLGSVKLIPFLPSMVSTTVNELASKLDVGAWWCGGTDESVIALAVADGPSITLPPFGGRRGGLRQARC